MKKKRVRLEEAFEFVKQRRSIISPNFSFMGQLLQFESQVLATSCSVEAASPSATLGPKSSSTPTSPFIFSFPVSVVTHSQPSSLTYLQSPITTSPSCWYNAKKTAFAHREGRISLTFFTWHNHAAVPAELQICFFLTASLVTRHHLTPFAVCIAHFYQKNRS